MVMTPGHPLEVWLRMLWCSLARTLMKYLWRLRNWKGQGDHDAESDAEQREAPILTFKDTRMLAFGVDNSAKLSAYLAAGCISPRMVYAELRKAAVVQGPQQCAWLEMHLAIRCASCRRSCGS